MKRDANEPRRYVSGPVVVSDPVYAETYPAGTPMLLATPGGAPGGASNLAYQEMGRLLATSEVQVAALRGLTALPLVVVLTGTDLYRDIGIDADAQRAVVVSRTHSGLIPAIRTTSPC